MARTSLFWRVFINPRVFFDPSLMTHKGVFMDPQDNGWQPAPFSLSIEGFGWKGEGYGRYRNQIISVPHTLPGDRVEVRCGPLHRGRAWGEILAWEERAAAHRDPSCPYYARCNGCALRHISYDDERLWKLSALNEILERYGPTQGQPITLSWIDAQQRIGHRTRGRFRVEVRDGQVHLGLRSTSLAGEVVDVRGCPAQSTRFLELLSKVAALLEEDLSLAARVNAVEILTNSDQTRARVVVSADPSARAELCEQLSLLRGLSGVEVSLEAEDGRVETILGPPFSLVVSAGLSVSVPPGSWCHTNPGAAALLLDWVAERVEPRGHRFMLDLCCALGSVTARLAGLLERVIAVDEDHLACTALKNAAREQGYEHIQVRPGRIGQVLRKLRRELHGQPGPTGAVINPMRKQLGARQLKDLASLGIRHLIYLGPSPVSAAKDAALLADEGFRLINGAGVNLHPATGQVMLALEFEHLDNF